MSQAATAAHNLHLTAELSDRLDLIRRQATELTASRARVAQTQDAERQRPRMPPLLVDLADAAVRGEAVRQLRDRVADLRTRKTRV